MPWLDPEKVGPFRPWDYGYALFFFALPTLLIVSAIYFSLATATRSLMWTYVGALALLVGYFVLRGLLREPQYDQLVALADPFGLGTLSVVTKYWTAAERNGQLPAIAGVMLANRAALVRHRHCAVRDRLRPLLDDAGRNRRNPRAEEGSESRRGQERAGGAIVHAAAGPGPRHPLAAALAAGAIRHGVRVPQPGVLRAARHRHAELARLALVRGPVLRRRGLPGDAADGRQPERRFHDHPDHHRDLLRRRTGLARPRPPGPRDRRRDAGAGLGVHRPEGPRDHARPHGHAARRRCWPAWRCRR